MSNWCTGVLASIFVGALVLATIVTTCQRYQDIAAYNRANQPQ